MENRDFAGRQLPVSIEAEQAVLGSVLIDPDKLNDIVNMLTSESFAAEDHREIWTAMTELYLQNTNIDVVTLLDILVKRKVYESVAQAREYLTSLAEIVPAASNIMDYARIVRDKSMLRSLISVCDKIADDAYTSDASAADIIAGAEQQIYNLARGNEITDFKHIRNILPGLLSTIKERCKDPDAEHGLQTGFGDLDRILVGLGPGHFVVVGARPGVGKTALALNIAVAAAKSSKKSVAIFSLEMPCEELVQRILSSEALVNSEGMRKGVLAPEDWTNLAHASSVLSGCDIYIDDSNGLSVAAMKSKLLRLDNLGLVIIDYLQLMSEKRKGSGDTRANEVAEISRNVKILAKELGVPVIACAQLNRESAQNRPTLANLRESGAIEQDADIVMFLHKPDPGEKAKESKNGSVEVKQNTVEVIVAKNRHGTTGSTEFGWFPQYTRFSSSSEQTE